MSYTFEEMLVQCTFKIRLDGIAAQVLTLKVILAAGSPEIAFVQLMNRYVLVGTVGETR